MLRSMFILFRFDSFSRISFSRLFGVLSYEYLFAGYVEMYNILLRRAATQTTTNEEEEEAVVEDELMLVVLMLISLPRLFSSIFLSITFNNCSALLYLLSYSPSL